MASWMRETPHGRFWVWCGALAILGAGLLVACYSVIGGWSMAYGLRAVAGQLAGLDRLEVRGVFYQLASNAEKGFGWQLLFIGLAVAASARGLRAGIEPVLRTLALLIALMLVLLLVGISRHAGADHMLSVLFAADFSALSWRGVLEALYQAFFT